MYVILQFCKTRTLGFRYPLLLKSGRDCAILDGFGVGICRMLDEQLKKERHLVSEQRHDESLRDAVNQARVRINQVRDHI